MSSTRSLPILLLLLLAAAASGEDEFRPASFGSADMEKSFMSLLKFPETQGDVTVTLDCFARVKTNGRLEDHNCYIKENWDSPFAEVFNVAAKKARVIPAMISGKQREVYLQIKVVFQKKGDEHRAGVMMNPGYPENVAAYGVDHIGAQRVLGRENWQKACPRRAHYALLAKAHVGEDGRASSPSIVHGSGIVPTEQCQQAIKDTLTNSAYIPAMADGVPVPSTFTEPFGN